MTQREFDSLLSRLDADRDRAAEAYNRLRDKLVNYCRLKGHSSPEDGADETFDRVAARLDRREEVFELAKYSFGVARLVCLENYRRQTRVRELAGDLSFIQSITEAVDERIFGLMARCFNQLDSDDRALLHEYYADAVGKALYEQRSRMAERMKTTINSMRLRVHRLRLGLEKCLQSNRRLLD